MKVTLHEQKLKAEAVGTFFTNTAQRKFTETYPFLSSVVATIDGVPVAGKAEIYKNMSLPDALILIKDVENTILEAFNEAARADEIKVDLYAWDMASFEEYSEAANRGDYEAFGEKLAQVVVEWPFAADFKDPKAYAGMLFVDIGSVIKAVNNAMTEIFQSIQ